jgi:adenylate cyclase
MIHRLRMTSGLVLMLYVTSHLLNHALGLASLELLEAGRLWFLAVWRNPVGTALLYGSLAGHVGLSLWGIYARRKLSMTRSEGLQHILGIAIPLLLIGHVIGTRGAATLGGTNDT